MKACCLIVCLGFVGFVVGGLGMPFLSVHLWPPSDGPHCGMSIFLEMFFGACLGTIILPLVASLLLVGGQAPARISPSDEKQSASQQRDNPYSVGRTDW